MRQPPEHYTQGALRQDDGSVGWRVWAPLCETVSLVTYPQGQCCQTAMSPEGCGYFVYRQSQVYEGLRYAFQLAEGREYPDPASRWQPEGVHRPSAVFFPESYQWSDQQWRGVPRDDLVIYELHVGAFTPQGTFEAIVPRLPQLAALGVTAIELMPVAQFPGQRNWGYDAVYPFAVQNSYGGPRALQRLIDAAHGSGLAVILDVVYNHLGPEGNYFGRFGAYFTDHYRTPWGNAINFDGPDSDPVRQFVIDNACTWVRDFHADGLRLDAVHAIYDFSAQHILADIQAAVQQEAARQQRVVHVIAESNQNDVRLVSSPPCGYGLDAVWSDDFHHSVHALLTGERDGYYLDFGRPEHLAKSYNEVFVYDGCFSRFRRRRHGGRVGTLDRSRFVVSAQNHDQVGNRPRADRFGSILPAEAQRLACGLLLLSPCMPLLFMGEEYGETRPFPFFCAFGDPALIEAVRRGRREEFTRLQFAWPVEIPDPQSADTFAAAKLTWDWPEGSLHAQLRQLYQDLLAARRRWPALRDRQHASARLIDLGGQPKTTSAHCSAAVPAARAGETPAPQLESSRLDLPAAPASGSESQCPPAVLVLQRGSDDNNHAIVAVANLTAAEQAFPTLELAGRPVLLSTEGVCYGGRRPPDEFPVRLLPYELVVLGRR